MNNHFLKLEELSPQELNSFDRDRTLFFMTLSPIENHGSHNPLGMDILESNAISNGVAEKFIKNNSDWKIVFCPHIPMGMGLMPGMGSITFKQRTIYNFLVEYLSGLTRLGFKYIFVSGFHAGLRHLVTVDEAIHYVNKKYNAKIVSPFGHSFTNIIMKRKELPTKELADIFKNNPGDLHGGMLETSFMLYIRPDLVKEYKSKKSNDISQKNPFKKVLSLKNALSNGYFGNPAMSEKRIGELILNDSIEMFHEILVQSMSDDDFLYKIKSVNYSHIYMRTNFIRNLFSGVVLLTGFFAFFKYKQPVIDKLSKFRTKNES